jgi:hypothetical protein
MRQLPFHEAENTKFMIPLHEIQRKCTNREKVLTCCRYSSTEVASDGKTSSKVVV